MMAFGIICPALLVCFVQIASAEFFYPAPFNAAVHKPVTLQPPGGTCGAGSSHTEYCRSSVDEQSVRTCSIAKCDADCPDIDQFPAGKRTDTFGILSSAPTTNCVQDSNITAPKSSKVKRFLDVPTGDCFLDLQNFKLFGIILSKYWAATFTAWVYPELADGQTGVLIDFSTSKDPPTLNLFILDEKLYIWFGTRNYTDSAWVVPRARWSHIAVQVFDHSLTVFFNGSFVGPAIYGTNNDSPSMVERYRVGNSQQGNAGFVGYLQEVLIFFDGLTNRDIAFVHSGAFISTRFQSECRCPVRFPVLKPDNNRYCVQNTGFGMSISEPSRLNENVHPLEAINDDLIDTAWISVIEQEPFQPFEITLSFDEAYEIHRVSIILYSPYPAALIIQRRRSEQEDWQNWQFFSQECFDETGFQPEQQLSSPDDISCKFFEADPNDVKYSSQEVVFDLLEGRPGHEDGVFSGELRNFMEASAIRLTLRGHPFIPTEADTPNHFYHGLYEVRADARCDCHGHATQCDTSDVPYQCTCEASTLTTGRTCTDCVEGAYKENDVDGYEEILCNFCNCNESGTNANMLDICEPIGGQCHCKEFADGRACDTCVPGYFNLRADNLRGCEPCQCLTEGTVNGSNQCHPVTSQCPCKPNVAGLDCKGCEEGYYSVDFLSASGCIACACDLAGTLPGQPLCNVNTGQCMCKTAVIGRACDTCQPGTYNLEEANAAGCTPCGCDPNGSSGSSCDVITGQCPCKPHVSGRRCDVCEVGFYALDEGNFTQNGCSQQCACDANGTRNRTSGCEQYGGQCQCKTNVEGRQCDACKDGAFGLGDVTQTTSVDLGCASCDCVTAGTVDADTTCDAISGQCSCKTNVINRKCDKCAPGAYDLQTSRLAGCRLCNCSILGTTSEQFCNDVTGQCPCLPGGGIIARGGKQCLPYMDAPYPGFGPTSGGTRITVPVGYIGHPGNVSVFLGDIPCDLDVEDSYPQGIICVSKSLADAGRTSQLGVPLGVRVITSDGTRVAGSPATYEYRPDPVITDITPRRTFLGGGIVLTVTGDYLDSVAHPILQINTSYNGQRLSFDQECHVVNATAMKCPTPNITLPDAGEESLPVDTPLLFVMGFRLDGVMTYANLSYSLPNIGFLSVYVNPVFYQFDEDDHVKMFRTYWPYSHRLVDIKGVGMTRGATADDYAVSIGDDVCSDIELRDNLLSCYPPDSKPAPLEGTERQGAPDVRIQVGNILFLVGHLRYETSFWQNSGFRAGVIGGLCALAALVILVLLLVWCRRRRRRSEAHRHSASTTRLDKSNSPSMDTWPMTDTVDHTTSKSKRFEGTETQSSLTYLRPEMHNDKPDLLDQLPRELRTVVRQCQIDKEMITFGKLIGEGHYGRVYLGQMAGEHEEEQTPVTVKTLRNYNISIKEIGQFLEETTLMRDFHHEHVLGLIGVAVSDNNAYVVMPYMENGDLKGFISNDDNMLTVGELIHFSMQIADGMHYLSEQQFVHRDLACRNCMINKEFEVKVADFGLSRDIYDSDYFKVSNHSRPLPVKWMALESLESGKYDSKTDVWAFGVLLWELLTRGCQPYPDIDNYDMKTFVLCGNRMDRPDYAPDEMYSMMLECWHDDPARRPSFRKIYNRIAAFLDDSSSKTLMRDKQSQQVPSVAYRGRSYLALEQ